MLAYILVVFSWLAGRFHRRMELELEVIALRHQLVVLRRQRPGRPRLSSSIAAVDLALPDMATLPRRYGAGKAGHIVHWHRQGFEPYWRRRSRSGRPSVNREVRSLIRQMNRANPIWVRPGSTASCSS
jgi:putative transposase